MARMSDNAHVPTSLPMDAWLAALAKPAGAPGGGAACGVVLAVSAGLLHMVAGYTDDPRAEECADRVAHARRAALDAAEADGIRSADFGAALALPSDDPERDARVRDAALSASRSSIEVGAIGRGLVPDLALLAEIGNPAVRADLAIAAETLAVGISGAAINLRADLALATKHGADASERSRLDEAAAALDDDRGRTIEIAARIRAKM